MRGQAVKAALFLYVAPVLLIYPAWAGAFDFKEHWKQPIPLQGPPPSEFSDTESSLLPEDCGLCHETQYKDWSQSRHSLAMGPGAVGQFGPPWLDPESVESCLDCHAPLGEQRLYTLDEKAGYIPNPNRRPRLAAKGLTCAACHVRKHRRYGPKPKKPVETDPPHGGFVEVENFGSSEFCKPCHQFARSGRRVAGKLLEDTYRQWRASEYGRKNVRCADCHMPDRRHLWKGIHDPAMTRQGVDITAEMQGGVVKVSVKNKGVGHYFPTYVTPQVTVVLTQEIKDKVVTFGKVNIGWRVELDLSGELYDTRIPPGGSQEYSFPIPGQAGAGVIKTVVTVYPDEFYNRFFTALLEDPPDGINVGLIQKARRATEKSAYILFEKHWP